MRLLLRWRPRNLKHSSNGAQQEHKPGRPASRRRDVLHVVGNSDVAFGSVKACWPSGGFLERRKANASAGDRRVASALWNLLLIVASAASDGIASGAVAQDMAPSGSPSRLLARPRELDRQQSPRTGSPAELELVSSGRDRAAVSGAHSRREPSSPSTGNHNPSTAIQQPRSHAAYPLRSTVRVVLRRIMVATGGAQARLPNAPRL